MDAFYFGCIRDSGHYLWDVNHQTRTHEVPEGFPCPLATLDGGLLPKSKHYPTQGVTYLSYINGWTLLSMADNSVDTRPGSVGVFILRGEYSYEDALGYARKLFPKVFERFTFNVVRSNSARLMDVAHLAA